MLLLLCLSVALAQPIQVQEYDVSFGAYVKKQKAGYSRMSGSLTEDGRRFQETNLDVFRMTYAGTDADDLVEERLEFSLQDGAFERVWSREGDKVVVEGRREGDQLVIVQDNQTRKIPLPKADLNEELRVLDWLLSAQPGDQLDSFTSEWTRDPVDVPIKYTYHGREKRTLSGVPVEVHKVSAVSDGIELEMELDSRGLPLVTRAGNGFIEIRREPREVAEDITNAGIEILDSGVRIDTKLGEDFVWELELLAGGLGDYQFPRTPTLKMEPWPDGRTLLKLRSLAEAEPEPLADRERYLKSTPILQTDTPEIRELLAGLELGETDLDKVRTLNHWVYANLEKRTDRNASTALGVLEHKAGDCTEHSVLMTTLVRAAGIPARRAHGLVYGGDEVGLFAHHAWVEVYLDGGWVMVDPTFDQVPADATHILQSREDEISGFAIAGSLTLEVHHLESEPEESDDLTVAVLAGVLALVCLLVIMVVVAVVVQATRASSAP